MDKQQKNNATLTNQTIENFLRKNNFQSRTNVYDDHNYFYHKSLVLGFDLNAREIRNLAASKTLITLNTQDDLKNLQSLIDERSQKSEIRNKILELLNKETEDKDPNNKDPRKNDEKYFIKNLDKRHMREFDSFRSYFGYSIELLDVVENSFSIEDGNNSANNKTYEYNDDNFKTLKKIIEEQKSAYTEKKKMKLIKITQNFQLVTEFFTNADRGFKSMIDTTGPLKTIYFKGGFDKQYYFEPESGILIEKYNGTTKTMLNITDSSFESIQDSLTAIDLELTNNNASKKASADSHQDDDKNTPKATDSVNKNDKDATKNKSNFSTNKIVCLALAALTLIASIVLLFTVGAIAASIAGGVGLILTGALVVKECFSKNDVLPSK